jgi:hypothetical protein
MVCHRSDSGGQQRKAKLAPTNVSENRQESQKMAVEPLKSFISWVIGCLRGSRLNSVMVRSPARHCLLVNHELGKQRHIHWIARRRGRAS